MQGGGFLRNILLFLKKAEISRNGRGCTWLSVKCSVKSCSQCSDFLYGYAQ